MQKLTCSKIITTINCVDRLILIIKSLQGYFFMKYKKIACLVFLLGNITSSTMYKATKIVRKKQGQLIEYSKDPNNPNIMIEDYINTLQNGTKVHNKMTITREYEASGKARYTNSPDIEGLENLSTTYFIDSQGAYNSEDLINNEYSVNKPDAYSKKKYQEYKYFFDLLSIQYEVPQDS